MVNLDCLAGSSEACELARSVDWDTTPIGPVDGWSQALRSTASLVLHNHSGMLLWWGPEFVQIYNDAYRPVLGDKHPRAMGQRFRDCWAEVFHILGPMAERPFLGGPASTSDDIAVPINRKVLREEAHFRLAYSPVPDQTVQPTGIGGVLATVTEITEQAYAERQLQTLRELGARSAAHSATPEQACAVGATALEENSWEVPFALFYLLDERGERMHLAASSGFEGRPNERLAPFEVALSSTGDPGPWPIRRVIQERQIEIVTSLTALAGEDLPASPWSERPSSAIVLPLASPEQAHVYGVLICGLSPHRVLDAGYRTFFELAAAQIVTAIRNARAFYEERKRVEALAEIDRAKTVFFSNVSHEFRTPLTLMLGPIEEAVTNPATPPPVRLQLELAQRNSLRLLKLVNSLLDFSRIEAGRVQASFEPCEIGALTADLASAFRSAIERAGLTFRVDCAALDEPVYVDREMWEKIVLNLLSNAFKFTLQGSITVRLRREEAQAVLQVADTGVGIPAEELPRLFERFHRVEGTAGRTQEGSGIGLALVQELVKLHGGTIVATSEQGHGTIFEVKVPLGKAHLPNERIQAQRSLASTAAGARPFLDEAQRWIQDETHSSSPRQPVLIEAPADARWPHTAGARIVLADDNKDMREYLHSLLSPRYVVEAVADGEAALEAIRQNPPDLLLSDIMMPRLDGLALLDVLRADPLLKSIPVILLSARAGEEARIQGLDAGADDYLVKPFSARELTARVGSVLELAKVRRERTDELALYRARLDYATRLSGIGFWYCNLPFDELKWDELVKDHFFCPPTARITIEDFYARIHEEDRERTRAAIDASILNHTPYDIVYRTVNPTTAEVKWIRALGGADYASDGTPIHFDGVTVDVSAQKRSEAAALVDAQRVQLALAAGAIIGTWVWDIPANCFTADESFARAFGLDPARCREGIPLDDVLEAVHPDDQEGLARAIEAATLKGGSYSRQYRVRRADGKYYWIEASGRVDHAPDGTPLSFPGVLIDVEGRRAVEGERDRAIAESRALNETLEQRVAERTAELMQSEEKLRQSQKMEAVGQLTGGLAHDFNNLLTGITGSLEMLTVRLQQGRVGEMDRYVHAAQGAAKRAAGLTHRLLAFARRQTLDPKPTDINRLIAGMSELLQRTIGPEVSLEIVAAGGLWATLIDPGQLESALLNLCINSRDAMPSGGQLTLETGNKWLDERAASARDIAPGQYVSLCVSDTGTGMSQETIARAFDPFFTTKPIGMGTGLGLSMVYGFARQSGGQVRIYSEVGQGTMVCLYLPRHVGDIVDPDQEATTTGVITVAQTVSVLVVDDEPTVRMLVVDVLQEMGCIALEAADGAAALKIVNSGAKIDLLVTDVGLPGGMNGRQLADAARVARADLEVLFITGYAENAVLSHGHLGHGMHVLTKPFTMDDLVRRIKTLLELKNRKSGSERMSAGGDENGS